MKVLKSLFLVVMLLVALIAVTDTAYGWPPCGYYDEYGVWHLYNRPGDTEYAWWVNALCVTHEVTLAEFNYYCHTNYVYPSAKYPCTIQE